jgi:RNA recognition motif-containing protein
MRSLVYVGNLPDSAAASDLEPLFRDHGAVNAAEIIVDPRTGRPLGYAFVEMSEGAEAAIGALHGTLFEGRPLIVRLERCVSDDDPQGSSPETRKAVDDLRERAETGDPAAARELADILYFPGPLYDPQAAYKWYYVALSQEGYTVGWEDDGHSPPHYSGPVGDFRNECMVSDLVTALGWEEVRRLDKEAEQWMTQRNLIRRAT